MTRSISKASKEEQEDFVDAVAELQARAGVDLAFMYDYALMHILARGEGGTFLAMCRGLARVKEANREQ